MQKSVKWMILFVLLLAFLSGCSAERQYESIDAKSKAEMKTDKSLTIADIAYNASKSTSNILLVLEDDVPVPFYVVSNDYQPNATLLVRCNVLSEAHRFNDYESYYENSEVDNYLNSDYIHYLSEINDYIIPVEIDITSSDSIGSSGNDTTQIKRSIFLLSYTEIGLSPSPTTAVEGRKLSFFENPDNRIAYSDNAPERNPCAWILRTPNTYFPSAVYSIGDNGTVGTGNANNENGIRPALCVDSNTIVEKSEEYETYGSSYVIKNNFTQ